MSNNFALLCEEEDLSYASSLKSLTGQHKVFIYKDKPITSVQFEHWAKQRDIKGVILTQASFIKKILPLAASRKEPSLSDYQGSLIKKNDIEYVVLSPLKQLVTVSYGKFIAQRFLSKIFNPQSWPETPSFSWEIFQEEKANETIALLESAILLGVDSETANEPLRITVVSYTAVFADLSSHTIVIPCNSLFNLAVIRRINANRTPKVLQNGKYDCAYFFRFNCVLENYYFDTINALNCWYAELPKDLGFIGSFFIRDCIYWKDLAHTGSKEDFYYYSARDPWATVYSFCRWLVESPDWAKKNYIMQFPIVFPSHYCEMAGLQQDEESVIRRRKEEEIKLERKQSSLNRMLGVPYFNTNSYKQKKNLLKILGQGHLDSTSEKDLKKAIFAHPLNERILQEVVDIQKIRKDLSYDLSNEKRFNGRILYALNPHATDTGRNASKAHHFWCGRNIQNANRENDSFKYTIIADPDFYHAEVDLEQAEARDVAYCSGEENLIAAVESDRDFHSTNAAAFFGKKYEDIYDQEKRKTKDKKLRDLSKRTNHGANYLMGPPVFYDTVGPKALREAQISLRLNHSWGVIEIATWLLERFHATYPGLRKIYYPWITKQVMIYHMLVGATGWTRFCFGNPEKSKTDLNAYVAHVSQSLNAMVLNEAFLQVFIQIQMHPEHQHNFRLNAQIHDSIKFQYRKGHEYLCEIVKKLMEIPVTVKGADGKTRTFTVPASIKKGAPGKPAIRWSETEPN